MGIISVDFDETGHLLLIYSEFVKYLTKVWENNEVVPWLFIDFKKVSM